jgi:hypothetical protein
MASASEARAAGFEVLWDFLEHVQARCSGVNAVQIPLYLDHGARGRSTAFPRPPNLRWPRFIPGNTGGNAGLYFPERWEFLQVCAGHTMLRGDKQDGVLPHSEMLPGAHPASSRCSRCIILSGS